MRTGWVDYSRGAWSALRAGNDPQRILELQNRQLRLLVRHCCERVPFYRDLYRRAGVEHREIRGLDDIHYLPIVSRADVQRLGPGESCAKGARPERLLTRCTSGSSGAPLTIRRHWLEERLLLALRLQATFAGGLPLRSRRVFIVHKSAAAPWKRRLYEDRLQNRLGLLRVNQLDWRLPKDELLGHLERFRPDAIIGPPSLLSWIAEELDSEDRARIRPQRLIVGGELCTPEMKAAIERGFGLPFTERYGSHEFVFLAARPPERKELEVCGASVIVEVLRNGRPAAPGESGEIVATALHSFAMPFVRYRLGDLVVRGEAPGWHSHSVQSIERVLGRTIDRFVLANGAVVHPYSVANVLRDGASWLRRFQIVQEERNRFRVRVVPFEEPSRLTRENLARKLESVFPEPVDVSVDTVVDLLPTETGKFFPYVAMERYQEWGGRPDPVGDPSRAADPQASEPC